MLDPKNLSNGCEQYEQFNSPVRRKKPVYQYDYRHTDGKLFSTVKDSLEKCREARDNWLVEIGKSTIKKLSDCKGSISDFLKIGDLVDEYFVTYFIDSMPPAFMDSGTIQMGEVMNHVKGKPTFLTLRKSLDGWKYAGECHRGELIDLSE